MPQSAFTLRPAEDADIPFIMSVEALPGYAERVGRFTAAEHREKMADRDVAYWIGSDGGEKVGFAVLQGLQNTMRNIALHRFAVARAGRGLGQAFLTQLTAHVFMERGAERFWLDVLPHNEPARRLYARLGFLEEGLMRQALRYPDGRRADLILMALLKEEWEKPA